MSKIKRAISLIICVLLAFSIFTSCKNDDSSSSEKPDTPIDNTDGEYWNKLDKEYVYGYFPSGIADHNIAFQAPAYALSVDTSSAKITGMTPVKYDDEYLVLLDSADFDAIADTTYTISAGGGTLRSDGTVDDAVGYVEPGTRYARLIEGGRNMQKVDICSINYANHGSFLVADNFSGRIEIAAQREYFALNYEVFNAGDTIPGAKIGFSIDFGNSFIKNAVNADGSVSVYDKTGRGFTFLSNNTSVTADVRDGIVSFEAEGVELGSKWNGFGIIAKPFFNGESSARSIIAQKSLTGTATSVYPYSGRQQKVNYDENRGVYVINVDSRYMTESETDYEKVAFSVTNNSDENVRISVAFEKAYTLKDDFNQLGYCPMVCDAITGEPTGIDVQISKNWHSAISADSPFYEKCGYWSMCYAVLDIPAGQTVSYKYVCAYEFWGGVSSVSHAQLCLIGYNGNWIWDESALGASCENVCYDPDMCLGRAVIDDVRPYNTACETGNYVRYRWSDNIGGADFLWYKDNNSVRHNTIGNLVNYVSQGPNMTDVVYAGVTDDGAIQSRVNIRMGRTDDVVRCYYTLNYTFLKDTNFSQLAFFKLGAETYASTRFVRYAYGNDEGITEDDEIFATYDPYVYGKKQISLSGNNNWFMLYSSDRSNEAANKMFVIREYDATINGKGYGKPVFSLANTDNGGLQYSFEVSPPAETGNVIKAGSKFSATIEFIVLPNPTVNQKSYYYGNCDYIKKYMSEMNTAASALRQAKDNAVSVFTTKGTIVNSYPVEIDTEEGAVKAEFTLTGGLGYTPIVFNGLEDYRGYSLEVNKNGVWEKVDQSVFGNDFWQVNKTPDGKYRQVYNVKNRLAPGSAAMYSYRLVKTK